MLFLSSGLVRHTCTCILGGRRICTQRVTVGFALGVAPIPHRWVLGGGPLLGVGHFVAMPGSSSGLASPLAHNKHPLQVGYLFTLPFSAYRALLTGRPSVVGIQWPARTQEVWGFLTPRMVWRLPCGCPSGMSRHATWLCQRGRCSLVTLLGGLLAFAPLAPL